MMTFDEILNKAKESAAKAQAQRSTPRFSRVMGKIVGAGLLVSNGTWPVFRGKISLKDYLWAAEIEPRLLELLPALMLKCPRYFSDLDQTPEDLHSIVRSIKRGEATASFRGVMASQYLQWIVRVGRRDKEPTTLKSFRFNQDDLRTLRQLQDLGFSEVEAVRKGLQLVLASAKAAEACRLRR